jgi:sugar lactone lactonase YvrE
MGKFYLAVLLCLLLPISSSAQLSQPESAVYDPPRNRYLISNYANGRIIEIDENGTQSIFAPGKNSSAGLHIVGDTLYVGCGSQGVLGYNLETGEEVVDITIPGSQLLNDISSDSSGNLYVSDPYGDKVYRISLDDYSYSILAYIEWPNGVLFDDDNNRLLICASTERNMYAVNLENDMLNLLFYVGLGHLDGLAEDIAGNFYISAQGPDAVYRYDKDFSQPPEMVSDGHDAPADIYYDKLNEILVVPNIAGTTVDFVPMPAPPYLLHYEFSDMTYGDGDGFLESGEDIEFTFSLQNYRPDTMSNLVTNLYVDDISITVQDENLNLGDLAIGEIGDNYSDPMVINIPADYTPRLDSFFLELAYSFRGDTNVDTVTMMHGIGMPPILLVDDSAGNRIVDYYATELNDRLIPYHQWTIPDDGTPSSGDLGNYGIVIWFTGDYRPNPIDASEVSSLTNYMDGGGKLFLTGQGIAAGLNESDLNFLNNHLKCNFESSGLTPLLHTLPGGLVFGVGDSVIVSGGDGANNQTTPDRISAMNGGIGELNYLSSSDLGAVSFNGDYQLVFFGFGFEAIRSGETRFVGREKILSDILDFFDCQIPNPPPAVSDLVISPGDPMHMIEHHPDISWTYFDSSSFPQAFYHIQVGYNDDWSSCEVWDSGPLAGSGNSVTYSGPELVDGEYYYFRIKANNGSLWSNWIYGEIRMNSVPVPSGLSPDDLAAMKINPPVLSHLTMSDPEGDSITYDYELYEDAALTIIVESDSGQIGGSGDSTVWQVVTTLVEDEDYYWRARCRDDYETGRWSETASFKVVPPYICGNANADGQVDVADAVFLIYYIFKGGAAPDPIYAGDANCDGDVNVGDAVHIINYVFKGGNPPCCPE